jgi:hypothetical protein
MRSRYLRLAAVAAAILLASWAPGAAPAVTTSTNGVSPTFASIGPLTFNPDGTLFAGDAQSAAIYALDLGKVASSASGAADVEGLDQKIAALAGTDSAQITITDLAIHPKTKNAYLSVMRGQGTGATAALFRVDGAGKIDLVAFDAMKYAKVELPNPPVANPGDRRNPRPQSITDMAFVDGRLWVAGLSNEEFASKLRAIPYPFSSVDGGTSVEIYHGNHGQLETRSPVFAFLPYSIGGKPHLVAGYTCTPLVKFPIDGLKPGQKIVGTTIAELGNRNRPLDMIAYSKDGREFLLMANNSRGVMKIPTAPFATAAAITAPVKDTETAGVPYETIAALKGVEQLDKLDDQRGLVVAREGSAVSLKAVTLP